MDIPYRPGLILPGDILPPAETQPDRFEVIVKFGGAFAPLPVSWNAEVEILDENYAIITLPAQHIPELYDVPGIQYLELPKRLSYLLSESLSDTCVTPVQNPELYGLTGRGVLVAIIDSGLDYRHPDFRNEDGTTRILSFWDQTATPPHPPSGFYAGVEYSRDDINGALASDNPLEIVPTEDNVGHGTAVAGIAAGNGRASNGTERGVAPEASLVIVKIGSRGQDSFPLTTELMRALKYALDVAVEFDMPLVVNLSFGSNNGAHDGQSLFETYINDMAQKWKMVVVVASGNEGAAGHHFFGQIATGQSMEVDFFTSARLPYLYLTLWKSFADAFSIEIISPTGISTGAIQAGTPFSTGIVNGVRVYFYYGQPTHYENSQELFIHFEPLTRSIPTGLWRMIVRGLSVVDGRFNIWLPTVEEVTTGTAFSNPTADTTLTLPSTSSQVISVGGYNARVSAIASFSGRGYTRNTVYVKPDLVAPAVNILTTRAGGGYDTYTGTSVAAPFVTGAAALMMQWGIVDGHDPFLYGERVKAFLQRGARRDANQTYPNPQWGFGRLCLRTTMDTLIIFRRPTVRG